MHDPIKSESFFKTKNLIMKNNDALLKFCSNMQPNLSSRDDNKLQNHLTEYKHLARINIESTPKKYPKKLPMLNTSALATKTYDS